MFIGYYYKINNTLCYLHYGSNTIKITVGAGGKGGTNSQNFNGENGYDGAAIIEYYG